MRSCPQCSSSQHSMFMQLDAARIFEANWSYRPDALKQLDLGTVDFFPIMECSSCAFLYAGLLPSQDLLTYVYDKVIDGAMARRSNLDLGSLAFRMNYLSTFISLLTDSEKEIRILDFGCGFGPTLHLLNGISNLNSIGYETSAVRLQELTEARLQATGDLSEVSRLAPFSGIILDNVLEHLPEPLEMLRSIRNLCGPATVLYVGVPDSNKRHMRRQQLAVLRGGVATMDINPWEHLNYFDLKHLDQILLKAGFRPLRQAELPENVIVGLRPDTSAIRRFKNGLASIARIMGYIRAGDACPSPTRRFYRPAA